MCLNKCYRLDTNEMTNKDRTVYKVVLHRRHPVFSEETTGKKAWDSPYYLMSWGEGESQSIQSEGPGYCGDLFINEISWGFYHTFKNFEDAMETMVWMKERSSRFAWDEIAIAECTIPKDTIVYGGTYDRKDCFASRSLRFNKIVASEKLNLPPIIVTPS